MRVSGIDSYHHQGFIQWGWGGASLPPKKREREKEREDEEGKVFGAMIYLITLRLAEISITPQCH